MKFRGQWRLQLAWRWLQSKLAGRAIILGYHRIASCEEDPLGLCVRPEHFDEQLAALRRVAKPMPLARLVQGLAADDVPARAVALTFDDGYVDNLCEALPILERHEIPATCFVVSGTLGQEFWWDEAVRLLRVAPEESEPPEELAGRWLTVSDEERAAELAALRTRYGSRAPGATARAMQAEELRRFASSPLVDVGAHTVSHPMLAALPLDAQRQEIEGSKAALEALIDRPVHGFSHPNGSTSSATRAIVRGAGFHYSCASDHDVVPAGGDRYNLPRFWVKDWGGDRFSPWLQRWLPG